MWELTLKLYDNVNLKKIQKYTKESNDLKSSLEDFAKNNCKILVEVPSCTASEGIYMMQKTNNSYHQGIEMEEECCWLAEIQVKLLESCKNIKSLLDKSYEMQRRKATEILMFVLSDTDRMYSPNNCSALPIAYYMKGYSLDVKTMCKLVNIIRDYLKGENIDTLSKSMDGQWINLIIKGHNNH